MTARREPCVTVTWVPATRRSACIPAAVLGMAGVFRASHDAPVASRSAAARACTSVC